MKQIKKMVMLTLAVMLLVNGSTINVTAAEREDVETSVEALEVTEMEHSSKNAPMARTLLYNCEIIVAPTASGMYVEFHTDSVGDATIIGVKDIKIQRKVWWGWSNVATSEGGSAENVSGYSCNLLYTGVGEGVKYRVCCTHFGDTGEYEEVENITDPFTYYVDGIVIN